MVLIGSLKPFIPFSFFLPFLSLTFSFYSFSSHLLFFFLLNCQFFWPKLLSSTKFVKFFNCNFYLVRLVKLIFPRTPPSSCLPQEVLPPLVENDRFIECIGMQIHDFRPSAAFKQYTMQWKIALRKLEADIKGDIMILLC